MNHFMGIKFGQFLFGIFKNAFRKPNFIHVFLMREAFVCEHSGFCFLFLLVYWRLQLKEPCTEEDRNVKSVWRTREGKPKKEQSPSINYFTSFTSS